MLQYAARSMRSTRIARNKAGLTQVVFLCNVFGDEDCQGAVRFELHRCALLRACVEGNRRFINTDSGYMGMAVPHVKVPRGCGVRVRGAFCSEPGFPFCCGRKANLLVWLENCI